MPGRRAGVSCSPKTKVLFMISSAWCCGSYIDRVFQHRIDRFYFFRFSPSVAFLFRSFLAGCLLLFHVPCVPALARVVPYWAIPSGMYGIERTGNSLHFCLAFGWSVRCPHGGTDLWIGGYFRPGGLGMDPRLVPASDPGRMGRCLGASCSSWFSCLSIAVVGAPEMALFHGSREPGVSIDPNQKVDARLVICYSLP